MGTNRVQRKGRSGGPLGLTIPPYLARKDNPDFFRLAVPAELLAIFGKSEIKKSIGDDDIRAARD